MPGLVIELSATSPVLPEFPGNGICILESRHAKGFSMAPASYDFWEVMLILAGAGHVCSGGMRHPVRAKDLVLVPKGTSYCFEDEPSRELAMFCLCLRPVGDLKSLFAPLLPDRFRVVRNVGISRVAATHFRAILMAASETHARNEAVAVAESLQLLLKLPKEFPAIPTAPEAGSQARLRARVASHIAQLQTTFHESESLEVVADRMAMSPRSLTHHFRALTGQSRASYLRGLRIRHSQELLLDPARSVVGVAFACGYEELSSFLRAFRKETGMSPTAWRESKAS
jgi:AraC family L-rhamnose operon regulatory protein RhaS